MILLVIILHNNIIGYNLAIQGKTLTFALILFFIPPPFPSLPFSFSPFSSNTKNRYAICFECISIWNVSVSDWRFIVLLVFINRLLNTESIHCVSLTIYVYNIHFYQLNHWRCSFNVRFLCVLVICVPLVGHFYHNKPIAKLKPFTILWLKEDNKQCI